MEAHKAITSEDSYKITCKNYPSDFILDKNLAKEYFRQFGKLRRLTFKPKLRICTVEYSNRDGYLNALKNSGDYKGTLFKVSGEKSSVPKKKKVKKAKPIWVDDDEVGAELVAMSGFAPKSYNFPDVGPAEAPKVSKLKRSWTAEAPPKVKKKSKVKEKAAQKPRTGELSQNADLINMIKSQATTVEEKYRVLEAKDKLIRIKLKTSTELKSSPTVGTCPDMCPEKERLMRETKHQVALYEQEDNGRSMNQSKAIKQYSRSSADQDTPLPHELRPVSVLQMTMSYLMHNIIDMCETSDVNIAEWYHFLWDRTRGIRKDITQQELCSQGAVELVEQCARFHIHCSARLVAEDPSVFDQKINTENLTKCLQSLKYMYHDLWLKGESCPNEAEFRAYIILLNLNDGNFMWEVQELRAEIQKSKEVKFALQVYSAIDKNNYVKFFKLVHSTSYLNACILMRYFVQVRIVAVKTLLKCYTSRAFRTVYPLEELRQILAFDDIDSTVHFMRAHGLFIGEDKTQILLDKNTFSLPELPYLLDRSLNVVESKRTCSVGRMVCGKDLPPRMFENHVPQNSFDREGYLVYGDLLEETELEETEMQMEESDGSSVKEPETAGFQQPSVEAALGIIFGQTKREEAQNTLKQPTQSIFSQPVEMQTSIFAKDPPSIFGSVPVVKYDKQSIDVTDSTSLNSTILSIFGSNSQEGDSAFPRPPPSIFGKPPAPEPQKTAPPTTEKKTGGFRFDLPITKASTTFEPTLPTQPSEATKPQSASLFDDFEQLKKKKEEEERDKQRKEEEELQNREEEEKKRLEEKREEERLRKLKKQKQEEELKKRMKALQREEERQKNVEIRNTVGSVLTMVVEEVDAEIRREQLQEIRKKMQDRVMLRAIRKWRQAVVRNKRKRKAMDCMDPVWVSTRTLEQSAAELHTASQELTLKLRKRYKYGRAFDIEVVEEDKINKINLFQLTYAILNRRFFNFKGTLQKNIFWKVEVSLPDHYELRNGLARIEDTLKAAFQWEDRNGTIMLVEQARPNPMQSVTYCIERQRGLYVRYGDANGIIFIAKDFNALLQRRILENLKNLGVFTRVPIVIILQEYSEGDCKLESLIEENIVSDYIILIQSITPKSLVKLIEQGLAFLASKVEEPPPLELDTLSSFLGKYLCTEIWKRANSFAKWNTHYKSCLRDPHIVLSLYNEALSKLRRIALNKSCFEYPSFPEVFNVYLQSEIPDYLPCNYCYFPKFWRSDAYVSKLERIFKGLALPSWTDEWPARSELDLELSVSKYCAKTFNVADKPFFKVMSVLLRDVDPNKNFRDVKNVLWTDVIEVLASEKLREANLGLAGTAFETKSIFNQFVVVYNVEALQEYNRSDWFYVSNPTVNKRVREQMRHEETDDERHEETIIELSTSIDLDKTIAEVSEQLESRRDTQQLRKELEEFNEMMNDLEASIRIHRRISSRIEENLKHAIADN